MGQNGPASAAASDQFEALYLALRRRLLLQCFALNGDLSAARSGVREAFISARQQWRRVGTLEHPDAWIRQRAMNTTQRRHVPYRRRARQGLSEQQIAVLDALGDMKDGERKALILRHLGDLDTLTIGRDLSITERGAQQRLSNAETSFARRRGCDRGHITEELRSLAPVVTHPGLPRAHAIHDRAHRRARLQIVLGVVMAAVLATVGGLLIQPTKRSDALALINARPVERAMFLTAAQVDATLPGSSWQDAGTSTNTSGTGLHDACQRDRFADNNAAGTWVRQFQAASGASLTQQTEVSIGDQTAQITYIKTLDWYANCSQTAAQLISAAKLTGVGNQAWLLRITVANKPASTYQVVVARSGMIISTLVLSAPASKAASVASPAQMAELSHLMTQKLCQASAAEKCQPIAKAGLISAVPPLPTNENRLPNKGMLIASDLPLLPNIARPWYAYAPVSSGNSLAAVLMAVRTLTCNTKAFIGVPTKARSFLILGAGLPQNFGITETVGAYPTASAASIAAQQISKQLSSCHKRQIGTQVDQQHTVAQSGSTPAVTTWHEMTQINAKSAEVAIWVGLTQYGRSVALVSFFPTKSADTTSAAFAVVVQRAAQRLTQQP